MKRASAWMQLVLAMFLLGLVSGAIVRCANGQQPQYASPYPQSPVYYGAPAFPVLDFMPHCPGRPIRNWCRVNVFGLPPLAQPVPSQVQGGP